MTSTAAFHTQCMDLLEGSFETSPSFETSHRSPSSSFSSLRTLPSVEEENRHLLDSIAAIDDLFDSLPIEEESLTDSMDEEEDAQQIDTLTSILFGEDDEEDTEDLPLLPPSPFPPLLSPVVHPNAKPQQQQKPQPQRKPTLELNPNATPKSRSNACQDDYNRLLSLMGLSSSALQRLQHLQPLNSTTETSGKTTATATATATTTMTTMDTTEPFERPSEPTHARQITYAQCKTKTQPSRQSIDQRLPYINIPKMDIDTDEPSAEPTMDKNGSDDEEHSSSCSVSSSSSPSAVTSPLISSVSLTPSIEPLDATQRKKETTAYRQRSIQTWRLKRQRRKQHLRNTSSRPRYENLSVVASKKQRLNGKFIKSTAWVSVSLA